MVLKRAKCDLNDVKIAIFAAKSQKSPSSWWICPSVTRLSSNGLFSTGPKSDNFCAKNSYFWFKPPLSSQNLGCASGRIHSCTQIFQVIIQAACETS